MGHVAVDGHIIGFVIISRICYICPEAFRRMLTTTFPRLFSPSPSGSAEVREQRNEHPTVQLLTSPLLAAQLHGRFHLVPALRRGER